MKKDDRFKNLIKQFGDVISDGHQVLDKPRQIIPFSPKINWAIGGGVLEGSWVILTGREKSGKTCSALSFASQCQKEEYGNRDVFYLSCEGRLKQRDIKGQPNLNLDKFHIISSSPKNILTGQKYLQIAEQIIHENEGALIIIDSFSSLVTQDEYNASMSDMQMASGAKLISKFCRKVGNIIPVNRNILLGITHVMANLGYGAAWKEKSGQSLAYQADYKLYAESFKLRKNDSGNIIGQNVTWKIITSALGCPGYKTDSVITFGKGIDYELELVQLSTDLNIIEKGGAWFKYNDVKCQGEDKMFQYIQENNLFDELNNKINNLLL